ncbi:hypothetical protein ACVNS2_30490 [Paenibacillus caseinilyticus]|uniref:Uncharacterized protein n=1 Tax=Paenibacillus mucilaginosus K02 TaxID=997761 RepID=R9ULR1_9BACL|nr:hypothetical protein [Paenibacillus mucilaginosus]AGN70789.1 hypothetical protein B2K_40135 [Paenibacillus mucilaginosus K02]
MDPSGYRKRLPALHAVGGRPVFGSRASVFSEGGFSTPYRPRWTAQRFIFTYRKLSVRR